MAIRCTFWSLAAVGLLLLYPQVMLVGAAAGQETKPTEIVVVAPAAPALGGPPPAVQPAPTDGLAPGPPGKPGERPEDKGPGSKSDQDKQAEDKQAGPKPIERPTAPGTPPNPDELRLKPDPDGKIQFQFHGQKWPDVLAWLADWSGMSLDWQRLPGDYLNLTTARKYTAREARDLVNQHLLARGYTMLIKDNVLWVCDVKTLDAGMVPRVTPAELAQRDPHEFVKVSFPLDWLPAEAAVKELEPMKSPNGKLSPLTATNRLEAMDSVTNLQQIHAVLTEEQSDDSQQHLVRPFKLRYTRAADVREQLMALLGLESESSGRPVSKEDMQRQMQMAQMQAQQQQQQQQQNKGGLPPKTKPDIYLVAIPRDNIILANAPPDKMAIIEQAILAIDVPLGRGNTYRASIERMHIYRLATIDPEPLVKTLVEIGNLDFNTRLEVDKQNRAIIAYASLPDHVTIRALIDKLDESARRFSVIQLRRLEADYVAGTVQFMMGGKEEKQQSERRRPYWDYGGRPSGDSTERKDEFSVDADVENNRLLLRANEDELGQVEDLLVKLGEIPAQEGDPSTVRVIDAPAEKGFDTWLDKVRRAWDGPNPLEIDVPEEPDEREDASGPADDREPAAVDSADVTTWLPADRRAAADIDPQRHDDRARVLQAMAPARSGAKDGLPGDAGIGRRQATGRRELPAAHARFVRMSQPDAQRPDDAQGGPATGGQSADPADPAGGAGPAPAAEPETAKPAALPPIRITRAPDGRLIIACDDPRALDRLEHLMIEFPPPRTEYEVFKLTYADATFTAMDLRDFFKEEEESSGRRSYWYYDYYYDSGRDEAKTPSRLSKRRPLKFIAHVETNSVLVQGATPAQLRTVRELITNVFDRREPVDAKLLRKSTAFKLRYSKASVIAETIKEVFRDLLSVNDKSLQGDAKGNAERVYNYNFGDEGGPKKIKFKGALSIGVDDISNTLLVSTSPQLMEEIRHMIEMLDEAARPTATVQVLNAGQGVSAAVLQKTLATMLGEGEGRRRDRSRRPPGDGDRPSGQQAPTGQEHRGR